MADSPLAANPAKPRFQELDSLSASQIRAVREIPPFGTQPPPAMTKHYPTKNFVDHARFKLEQERVFKRIALPLMPSAMLPEPGNAIAHQGYGLPLLVVRGKDNQVRVFLNACKHKGAKLVESCNVEKASRFTCPYHSWTYGLDGSLLAVARNDAFEAISRSDFALTELQSREFGGLIWVGIDRHQETDFSALVPELGADFDSLELGTAHVYGRRTFRLKANWKLVLEPFMESYHVPRLHKSSIGDLFGDVTRVVDLVGPHQRKTAGKANYHPDMLGSEPGNIHKLVTFAYQLFPSGVLITSPYYISVMILMPASERETVVDYYMLTREAPQTPKAEELYSRSLDLILKVFGEEDFRAAEISQEGLESGALENMTYGGMENTIPMFYDQLEDQLRA